MKSPPRPATERRTITDPADFWTLVGRFAAGQVLNVLLASAIIARSWPSVVLFAVVSALVHRAMFGLYRRLRDERQQAQRAAESEPGDETP